ncbi:MAG TPA: acyl-CoA dehydrogenase family protein [Dehalococcoidia bacterium]|nr:acyl-CoA dehydrogenase family protein [Dehalococcoidia bacterium]
MTTRTVSEGEALVEAARALRPFIRKHGDEIEAGRRLPAPVVEAMQQVGAIRMTMPREWGGPEADPMTQIRVIEELSIADGSVGWCAMIGSDGGYFSAYLDPDLAREMYRDLDSVTASVVRPSGRAVVVDGGYRVTGRWAFASGCQHSAWFGGMCLVIDGDTPRRNPAGQPETRFCFMPAEQVAILDTWTTTGLRGSGSHDFEVRDVFVPEGRTYDPVYGPIRRPGPLYQLRSIYLSNLAGVPLGLGRAAIDAVIDLAETKSTRIGTGLRDEPYAQAAIGRAEALIGSARAYALGVMEDVWNSLVAGRELTAAQRARYRLSMTHAFVACTEAVDLMYHTAGGTALYATHPLDRIFRDMHTINQHFAIGPKTYEAAGRLFLGLEPGLPMF